MAETIVYGDHPSSVESTTDFQDAVTIDFTGTEALLIRKDADGGDVFIVDTTNDSVTAGNAAGPAFQNEAASATNPTLIPDKSDLDTGIGHATNPDELSLIAGAIEGGRILEANGDILHLFTPGTALETVTNASSAGDATLTKAGDNFDITCEVGDIVWIYGGSTAADFGTYIIRTVTSSSVLTLDRSLSGTDSDVDFDVYGKEAAIIDNSRTAFTKLRLPQENDASDPTLGFGNGRDGFYAESVAAIGVSLNGVKIARFNTGHFQMAAGGRLMNESESATNPTVCVNSDTDTGLGSAAADQLSLIAGGAELLRLSDAGGTKAGIFTGVAMTASGTDDVGLEINQILNASSAGGSDEYRGLKVNLTETDVTGWDSVFLFDLQAGSSSKFSVDNVGGVILNSYATPVESAEHGAGAIGTAGFGAPQTYRWIENGIIITQIKFDLQTLLVKGDVADDAIAIASGAAYIGRNVVATNGVIFKVELSCVESPGEGTATITSNIDIHTNSSAVIAYDGAVGTNSLIDGATLLLGQTVQNLAPVVAVNEYYYIVEADTTADTGEYNAGQYVLTTYGHAVLA